MSVSKPQDKDTQEKSKEVVDVVEDTEIDEERVVIVIKSIVRSMVDRVK